MFVLPVIFLVAFLGRTSQSKETLFIPVGDSIASAKLGKAFSLAKFYYMIPPVVKDIEGNKIVTPLNTYKETVRVIDSPADVAEVTGFSQPVNMLLSSGVGAIGGAVEDFMKRNFDVTEAVELMFYAEKLTKKEEITANVQPVDNWENDRRLRKATHYVKEIVYGSLLFFSLTVTPTKENKLKDIRQKITEILEEDATVSNPFDSIKKIQESLQGKITMSSVTLHVEGRPPNGNCVNDLGSAEIYLSRFKKSAKPIPLKVGLRPLNDFNPKNDAFITKYNPDDLAPYMDMAQMMYFDLKTTTKLILEVLDTNDGESFSKLCNTVGQAMSTFINIFHNLNFNQDGEQFLEAFRKYKYRVGYYQSRWKQLYETMQGNHKEIESAGGDFSSNEEVVKKVKELIKVAQKLVPGKHFTAKLNSAISGKKTVIFSNLLSEDGKLYDVSTGVMTAPDTGLYHVTYILQKESIRKTAIAIMKNAVKLAEGTSDDGEACSNNDCSQVISGSFTTTLHQKDKLKVELIEGKLGSNSIFSVTFLREL